MKKRVLILLMTVTLLLSQMGMAAEAANRWENTGHQRYHNHCGLQMPTLVPEEGLYPSAVSQRKASPESQARWEAYSSDYSYERMTETEKEFYDRLNAVCLYYATGAVNCGEYMKSVSFSGLTFTNAYSIMLLFLYQNPQYYFVDRVGMVGYSTANSVVGLPMYEKFKNGENRLLATDTMFSVVEQWEDKITREEDLVNREKAAHDLVCNQVEYGESTYDQSSYSVFCGNETVCAGYAQAFAMLMNGVGIETVVVTSAATRESEGHEWNRINLYGNWYNVDPTWNDGEGGEVYYEYFNRSDAYLAKVSRNSMLSHKVESIWNGKYPVCLKDSGATAASVGSVKQYENSQTIQASDQSKVYGNAGFNLNAKSSDPESIISYRVKNARVAQVDEETGYVVLKDTGKTIITVTASETEKSPAAEKNITLTVRPQKSKITHTGTPASRSILVKWKKQTRATGYQIQYSTGSDFSTSRSIVISGTSTISRKIIGLKNETGYFIRVRAYKTEGGTKIYGTYSDKSYIMTSK